MAISYKDSGVDWQKGDAFVERIRSMVTSTYSKEVKTPLGGFASLYDVGNGKLIAACCDGVGTKLKVAQILKKHDTVGIDLVAMSANDVICTGAKPLFFLDYIASGKLELETNAAIVKGIVEACKESNMALLGGETAEMPGMYQGEDYDLAGFCVAEVMADKLVTGENVAPGDDIVCLPSSGPHSNGYSLIRKLIQPEETELLEKCLTPTKLYVVPVVAALEQFEIKGMANITGSGFHNIPRINKNVGYDFTNPLPVPEIFQLLQKRAELSHLEMFSTFNMGTGFVMITENGADLVDFLESKGHAASLCGKVTDKPSEIKICLNTQTFTLEKSE